VGKRVERGQSSKQAASRSLEHLKGSTGRDRNQVRERGLGRVRVEAFGGKTVLHRPGC